jgi:hypothetical protein
MQFNHIHAWTRLVLSGLLAILSGCQSGHGDRHRCDVYPPGAVPAPAGTHHRQWQAEQTARADRDYFVFYQYEWLDESDQLGPFGQRHLRRLCDRLQQGQLDPATPMMVEPSGDERLDESRVTALKGRLIQFDPAWSEQVVIVGWSDAEPLYGFEAPRVLSGFSGGGQIGNGLSGGQISGGGGGGGGVAISGGVGGFF